MTRPEDPFDYRKIEKIYRHLQNETAKLELQDLGAGSVSGTSRFRPVGKIVAYSSINGKYGKLLSRLVRWMSPSTIIELGTGAGFSAMYMATACDHCTVFSIEGSPEMAHLADRNIKSLGLKNIEIITGSFNKILPVILPQVKHPLLIFIDGDHVGHHLKEYYESILPFADEKSVFVLDDIRWSKSMEKAWKEIVTREEVSLSIDLFRMGILFVKRDMKKQHCITFRY